MTAGLSRGEKVKLGVAFGVGALALPLLIALLVGATGGTPALNHSVAREARSAFASDCRRVGDAWRCSVYDRSGSGQAGYRLKKDGDCWTARRVTPERFTEGPMPTRLEGCVGFRDRYPLFDSLLDIAL
jgi:hypothetical protein